MSVKKELRKKLKQVRKNIPDKSEIDEKICENLICSDLYLNADTILFYAALDDEINIDSCITDALSLGKKAALPLCTDNNGNMSFYYINSLEELTEGSFSVREPDVKICKPVEKITDALCVVPGISFDKFGYRLGYGKGYYDRFLENFPFNSIGLCYNVLVEDELPHDKHDKSVDYIITENGIFIPDKQEERNG